MVLTKAAVRNQVRREMARSVSPMTEGRHRVGTACVDKNGRFGKLRRARDAVRGRR